MAEAVGREDGRCGSLRVGEDLKRLVAITDEFEICMAVGDDKYEAADAGSYKATAPSMTSPKLQVEKKGKGCALIERKVIDFGELIDINGWELTVAKGIDPILMIALISTKHAIKDK